jgi:hypothetical protein
VDLVNTAIENIDLILNLALLALAIVAPGYGAVALRAVTAVQKARVTESALNVQAQAAHVLAAATPRALAYARERVPEGSLWEQAAQAAEYALRTLPDTAAKLNATHDTLVMRYLAELRIQNEVRLQSDGHPSQPY